MNPSMEYEQDWAATGLFSPSKARQQQAAAKDWSYVDGWLARKYHPKPVPRFERNDDTLQALLALAAFNEKADEEEELVTRVEKAALEEMETKSPLPLNENITTSLQASLSEIGSDILSAQAESAVILSSHTIAAPDLAQKALTLTTTAFELEQQLNRVTDLQKSLAREHAYLQAQLHNLKSDSFIGAPDLPEKTADCIRQTKILRSKLGEYEDRLAAGRGAAAAPGQAMMELEARKREFGEMSARLKAVERGIAEFEGIPPDLRGARQVMEEARRTLLEWVERRDRLFEGLVEGER